MHSSCRSLNTKHREPADILEAEFGCDDEVYETEKGPVLTSAATNENRLFTALETLGRGEDPFTQGIEQTTEQLVKISYEHFPQGTEQVLNALSYMDTAINAVVEFMDDNTGNTASAVWQKLDEPTQARILGAGRVLSVVVPVARVKGLAELGKGVGDYVNLANKQRTKHILDGDATGGGHRPNTGSPGKSEFPDGWTDGKIMHEISDIATDPNAIRKDGRGGRVVVDGTRDGIDIRVIQEKSGEIVTGFPTNTVRNPK